MLVAEVKYFLSANKKKLNYILLRQVFMIETKTGHQIMPTLNFEIFLKFPHLPRSSDLRRLVTREHTRTFNFW